MAPLTCLSAPDGGDLPSVRLLFLGPVSDGSHLNRELLKLDGSFV